MVEMNKAKGGKQIVVEENPVSRWLFSNTMSAWIWLVLRLYLGYSWLVAGWGKITDPAWTGEQAGVEIGRASCRERGQIWVVVVIANTRTRAMSRPIAGRLRT